MKKNNLLLVSMLVSLVLISMLFLKKTEREKYEEFLKNHEYSEREVLYKEDVKAMPKADRPDLAMEQDFLKTLDPALGYPPRERLLPVYQKVAKYRRLKSGIPGDAQNNWVERGPNNFAGRVRSIMFDPNDVETKKVWSGSVSGGLWYNNDITSANSSWIAVNDFWSNMAVSSIVYDPTNTQVFYVGTGQGWHTSGVFRGAGVWKTLDGGLTWDRLISTENDNFLTIQKLAVTETGRVIAATNKGIFNSDDGGDSWNNVSNNFTSDIEIASNGDIYAAKGKAGVNGAVLKSINGGDSYTDITPDGKIEERVEIALAPSNANVIYAVASLDYDVSWLMKSVDGGTTWDELTVPKYMQQNCQMSASEDFTRGQAWFDLILAVHPLDEDMVFAGGINIEKSVDGGDSWESVSYWTGTCLPYVHADQHAIAFRPGHPNEALFGSDGGISYSSNVNAESPGFIDRNLNFNITQYYAGAMHPDALKDFYLAGSQDNGSHKFESSGVNSAEEVWGGDGAFCFIDQLNPDVQIVSYVYNNYYVSKNSGKTFSDLSSGDDGDFINPADYDSNLKILYSAKGDNSLSRVKGVDAVPSVGFVSGVMGGGTSAIKVSPYTTTSTTLFVGSASGRLFKFTEAQGDAAVMTELTYGSFPVGNISSIELGQSEDEIILTFSNFGVSSVWYTADGGTNWFEKEGDLPDMPVRWALFNPNNNAEVILATEIGIWSTTNFNEASPNWTPSVSGLANVRVDMLKLRPSDNQVLAVTHGRGLFTSDAFSNIDKQVLGAYFSTKGSRNIGEGGNVSFEDLSTGNPTSWSWTFEGGTPVTSNEQNPKVSYLNPGNYEVGLTVSDGTDSKTITKTEYITVKETGGWIEQATAFSESARGVDYIDVVNQNVVWATAFDGTGTESHIKDFTRTIDGGETWISSTLPIEGEIYPAMVCAISATKAWIPMYPVSAGTDGGIYKTTDGGTTWEKQESATFSGSEAFANVVYFWDDNTGFCMGDPNGGWFEIYTTSDGGANWTRVSSNNIPSPLANEYGTVGQFSITDDGVAFFNTTKGRIFKSVDKGASWTAITTPIAERMKIAFANENEGFIAETSSNSYFKAYVTTDGGNSWTEVDNTNVFPSYIDYVQGTDRMYVSTSANSAKSGASYSIDGGLTWKLFEYQLGKQCIAVDFYDMSLGWVGQFNLSETDGGVLRYDGPTTLAGIKVSSDDFEEESNVTIENYSISKVANSNFVWDFGEDATPATADTEGPHSVVYSTKGMKTVTFTIDDITVTKEFEILEKTTTSLIDVFDKDDYCKIYPNPSIDGKFVLEMKENINERVYVYLYSLSGALIHADNFISKQELPLNFSFLKKGAYLLKVRTNKNSITKKIYVK